jgi:glycosyltransferase involved in cell wall biosynthesis
MPLRLILFLLVFFSALYLLFGDHKPSSSITISPEKAAALQYAKWQRWGTVEPPHDRIRVLWIDQDYVPWVNAGSEICSHAINRWLIDKPYKWDVFVATPGYPKVTYDGVRCFNLYDTNTLLEVLRSTHMICSHSYAYRDQLLYICRVTGIPFVGWVHTDNYVHAVLRDHGNVWNDVRCAGRQWTIFNSNSMRDLVKTPVQNSTVFIPTVDYREYRVTKHAPRYVTLSNLNYNKGGDLLIKLARACPDIEFLGVRGGYAKQIVDATPPPNLTYMSHTTRIKDIYEKTWVQIMPSLKETWGRTAVEAMASGIPAVVSPTPGLRECCGAAAVYVDRYDLEGWVTALRKLKDDPEWYKSRSKIALERARALDPRPVLANIEEWLETQVAPSRTPLRELSAAEKNLLFR